MLMTMKGKLLNNTLSLFFIFLTAITFAQFRVDYEVNGNYDGDTSTSGAVLLGYDFIKWKQKNINSGIGFNINVNESPKGKRFNSVYCIVNYNVEEKWNIFSKVGASHCSDKDNIISDEIGMLLGIGANYNFNDNFHLELGYHVTTVENYDYERLVLSYIKHFEFDK